jgi:hypothetical protein
MAKLSVSSAPRRARPLSSRLTGLVPVQCPECVQLDAQDQQRLRSKPLRFARTKRSVEREWVEERNRVQLGSARTDAPSGGIKAAYRCRTRGQYCSLYLACLRRRASSKRNGEPRLERGQEQPPQAVGVRRAGRSHAAAAMLPSRAIPS